MPLNQTVNEPQPVARYQGSSEWGTFGTLHFFTILNDMTKPHRLCAGTTVTSKVIAEIGCKFDLTTIKKDDLVYANE